MTEQDEYGRLPVIPLGHAGTKTFFYFVLSTRQVVALKPTAHTRPNLIALAEEEDWSRSSMVRNARDGIDWDGLAAFLMARCREKGIYDPTRIRGRGAWRDGDDIVYHSGDTLFVNGRETPFEDYRETKYRYLACTPTLRPDKPGAPPADIDDLLATIETWGWQHSDLAPKIVVGWLACALVCGALRWRPHLWITGPKQSGKSTLDTLVTNILGDLVLHVQGGTTEPGLRQALNGDALPVAFDEFEGNNPGAQKVIDAARSAASDNFAPIIKGTPEGRPLMYQLRFMGMFSGVVANVERAADESRFVFLELRCRKRDEAQRARLDKALRHFNPQFGSKLLRQMLDALASGTFDQNLSVLRTAIRLVGGDERKADVFAHLLAGFHSSRSDTPITEPEAKDLVALLKSLDETGPSDEEACALHLLGHQIKLEYAGPRTVAEWLHELRNGNPDEHMATSVRDGLARHGILLDGKVVVVANQVPGVLRIYHGSPWASGGHWRMMRRLEGARAAGNRRFAGLQSKATAIPWAALMPDE